jgi:hypothetical protein
MIMNSPQELNGHKEMNVYLPNTSAIRTIINSDTDIRAYYGTHLILRGILTGGKYHKKFIEGVTYDTVYEKLKRGKITGDYFSSNCTTVLQAICTAAGITYGGCPSVAIGVSFISASCWDAAMYVCDIARGYYSSNGVDTFTVSATSGSNRTISIVIDDVSKRDIDNVKVRNHAIARGRDEDGAIIEGHAYVSGGTIYEGDPGSGYNDYITFNAPFAADVTTLQKLAARKLEELMLASSGSTIRVPLDDAIDTGNLVRPGDVLQSLSISELELSGNYVVFKATYDMTHVIFQLSRLNVTASRLFDKTGEYESQGIFSVEGISLDDPVGAPAAPANVGISSEIGGIRIYWDANTEADFDKYIIFRDTSANPTVEYARTAATEFIDLDVVYGTTYYYRLKAVDRANNASGYSNEVNSTAVKFDADDHVLAETVTSTILKKGIQMYNSDLVFVPKSGAEQTTVSWAAGNIRFADGTTQSINSGDTGVLTAGVIYHIYFTVGSNTLGVTTTYSTVVSDTTGLLATVGRSSTSGQQVQIHTFRAKGENINADMIAANAILANALAASIVAISKLDTDALARMFTGETVRDAIQGWRHASDLTLIDGGDIYTGTVTVSKLNADATNRMFASQTVKDVVEGWRYASTTYIDGGDIYGNSILLAALASEVTGRMFSSTSDKNNVEGWEHISDATYIDGGMIYTASVTIGTLASTVIGRMFSTSTKKGTIEDWEYGSTTYIDGGDIYTETITIGTLAAAVTSRMFSSSTKKSTVEGWEYGSTTYINGGDIYTSSITVGALASAVIGRMFTDSTIQGIVEDWQYGATTYIDGGDIYASTVTAAKVSLLGIDALGKLVLSQIGSGDLDDISDGTYQKVHGSDVDGSGYVKLAHDQILGTQAFAIKTSTGTTRIDITSSYIAGYASSLLQFYLQASDGLAYCGNGAVILDRTYGIRVYSQAIYFYDGTTQIGYIYGDDNYTPDRLYVATGGNRDIDVNAAGSLMLIANIGDVDINAGSGAWINLQDQATTRKLVAYTTNTYDIGDSSYRYKDIYLTGLMNSTKSSDQFHFAPSGYDTYYWGYKPSDSKAWYVYQSSGTVGFRAYATTAGVMWADDYQEWSHEIEDTEEGMLQQILSQVNKPHAVKDVDGRVICPVCSKPYGLEVGDCDNPNHTKTMESMYGKSLGLVSLASGKLVTILYNKIKDLETEVAELRSLIGG